MALRSLASGKPPNRATDGRFLFGRVAELGQLERDIDAVGNGRSTVRFIVGEHGAGKTALLDELLRQARAKRFVTMHADISRDCLFWGREGEARSLLEQALLNMRTLGSGDRCAMDALVGGFHDECEFASPGGRGESQLQRQQLAPLGELSRGYDFIRVLVLYGQALESGDELAQARARRWLLAQHRLDTDARQEVGASAVADCDQWSMIKLWARFARLAGRPGLVVVIDELRLLANLTKPARDANYAQLFRIFNETLSGHIGGLALFVAATPAIMSADFDSLCSEAGLNSCLRAGKLVGHATDAIDGAAMLLTELGYEDNEAMLLELRDLIGEASPEARLIPRSDIGAFIEGSRDELGGQQYPLPRDLIRQFLALHNRLCANRSLQWTDVLNGDVRKAGSVAAMAAASGEFAERVM